MPSAPVAGPAAPRQPVSKLERLPFALEIARLTVHEAAATSANLNDFLQQAVDLVCREIPVTGIAAWVISTDSGRPTLVASSGFTPGSRALEEADDALSDRTVKAKLSPLAPDLHVESTRLAAAPGALVAVWIPRSLESEFPDAAWISRVFGSGLEALRLVDHARQSLAVLSACMRQFDDALIGLNSSGRCLLWNPAAERLFGWPASDCLNRPLRIIARQDEDLVRQMLETAAQSGRTIEQRLTGRRWDGHEFPTLMRVIPIRRDVGEFPSLIVQIRSLEQTQSEQHWTSFLIERLIAVASGADLVDVGSAATRVLCERGLAVRAELWIASTTSPDWDLLAAAPAGARDFDVERQSRRLLAEIRSHFEAGVKTQVPGHGPGKVESRLVEAGIGFPLVHRKDLFGAILIYHVPGEPLAPIGVSCCEGFAAALAERLYGELSSRKLQETSDRLMQAEKLSSLGLLTSSVAHDLNNILTVIYGYCSIMRSSPDTVPNCVSEIHRAAEKAGRLARQLLQVTRRQAPGPAALPVQSSLEEMRPLLTGLLGGRGDLKFEIQDPSASIAVSRSEFDQLLLNLVANARDAIKDGGTVLIRVAAVDPDLHLLSRCPQLKPGPTSCLQVIDSGCGIPAGSLERIFEPFYTTKPAGSGTGIGLQTVRQIVERHRGGICVDSEVGQGTVMSLYLPRVSTLPAARSPDAPAADDPHGTERVVVLESDPRLRTLLARLLELRGYRVVERDPAERDVAGFTTHDTDLVVFGSPELLAESLTQVASGRKQNAVKRLVLSDSEILEGGQQASVLLKPFTSDEFSRAVRATLDG